MRILDTYVKNQNLASLWGAWCCVPGGPPPLLLPWGWKEAAWRQVSEQERPTKGLTLLVRHGRQTLGILQGNGITW